MKKILKSAALLTALCILFNCSIICFASEKAYQKGDIIEFGSYPQSKVTDESIISELNKYECKWTDVTGEIYSEKLDDYIDTVIYSYADSEHNGEKYRAVKYSDSVAENIENTSTEIQWFRYEPIEWVIVDPETGYILCNDIIDIQQFKHFENGQGLFDSSASQWETSDIRTWLNDEFYYIAFSDNEKLSINDTKTNVTIDKLVLFSLENVLNSDFGFNTFKAENYNDYYYANETLHRDYTQYSAALDVGSSTNKWLLRKTTGNFTRPAVVYQKAPADFGLGDTGKNESFTELLCKIDYFDHVTADIVAGVVPAMHINLDTFNETIRYGDIDSDGKITASDARLTLRASVGLENLSEASIKAADIDKNGTVSASDARLILRASVGLEDHTKW